MRPRSGAERGGPWQEGKRNRNADPQEAGGGPSEGVARREAWEASVFHRRQIANRLVEVHRKGLGVSPRAIDSLYLMWALYLEPRISATYHIIAQSTLRVPWQHPVDTLVRLMDELQESKAQDFRAELRELADSVEAIHGTTQEEPQPQDDSASDDFEEQGYWRLCLQYWDALGSARSSEATSRLPDDLQQAAIDAMQKEEAALPELAMQLRVLAAATDCEGIDVEYYAQLAVVCDLMVAENRLRAFCQQYEKTPPALPQAPTEAAVQDMMRRQQDPASTATESDYIEWMKQSGEVLDEGEQLYMEEVPQNPPAASGAPRTQENKKSSTDPALHKPDRFCKVRFGYRWNQYNRAHYDTRTNPPPKCVIGYEFTLMYPEIAATQRTPKWSVAPTSEGWGSEFCLITFSAGPPYLDVTYRIVNHKWEKRRGGVRCTFDAQGKFRLSFRFESYSYRR